jgi:glycosyltransferase involved in cell wall biosynthesis
MHGCYETLLQNPAVDPLFPAYFDAMKQRVNHWIYTAEKNTAVFEAMGWPRNVGKILNGYQLEAPSQGVVRSDFGIRDDSLAICLASRAIESKGWLQAVDAVTQLNAEGCRVDLMLIGEGPVADQLSKSSLPEFIRLHGQVSNLQDYIAVSDIGILPSYFVGESMPLVVIEMLAQGKPVISTTVGEIPMMLKSGDTVAGDVIDLTNGKVSVSDIKEAIKRLQDSTLRAKCGKAASRQFEAHFKMDQMMKEYEALYLSYMK